MVLRVGKKSEIRLKSDKFDPCFFRSKFPNPPTGKRPLPKFISVKFPVLT